MKIISIIILVSLTMANNCVQTNSKKEIISFINDLQENKMSIQILVENYFIFREEITLKEKQEVILPMLKIQLDLLREKLNQDCSKFEIIKHDNNSDIVKSYKLKHSNLSNVYYIMCEGAILTPILVNNDNKILSVTTHSKTKEGTRGFMIY